MTSEYLVNGPVDQEIIAQNIEKLRSKINSGGHSFFLGQVRADKVDGKTVKAIEYSAYDEMVKVEVEKIVDTVMKKFDDVNSVNIVHSVGTVKAGEISLLIFVSAGHRRHAIDACSETVELIKERLPVWKKEIYDDNTYEWKQNEQET